MGIAAGRLRHRVTIQEPVDSPDAMGGVVTTWQTVADSVPAEIVPLSAREFLAMNQINSSVIARITMRGRRSLEPAMRILHRGDVYNIEGILNDPDSGLEYVTIPVSKGVNQG